MDDLVYDEPVLRNRHGLPHVVEMTRRHRRHRECDVFRIFKGKGQCLDVQFLFLLFVHLLSIRHPRS